MRNYIITYSWPEKYRGSYLISAEDGIEASNIIEEFLDITYQDELIERVWPNMKITE